MEDDKLGMLGKVGIGLASGAVGSIMDIGFNTLQNKLTGKQNLENSKKLTSYQREQQEQLWRNTGATAQVEELKKAGLNVGMIYGSSGAGGSTGAGASGTSGSAGNSNSGASIGMVGQLSLIENQVELIKAQADKARAEAENLRGVDRTKTEIETKSLVQGIENQKATAELTKIQTNLSKIRQTIENDTIEEAKAYIKGQAEFQAKQIEGLGYQNEIDRQTVKEKVNIVKAELAGIWLENALKHVQKLNTIQMTEESKQRILQKWKELQLTENKNNIDKFKAEITAEYPSLQNVAGKLWDDLFENLDEILGSNDFKKNKN